ncbi:hypothetical protein CA264_16770 [Pontibacter actiniarum]|uniref:STAS/SEC14 domain-containing protein n=1 Tax=Pontibacter actiniarum TaxID=323450 RepID=A0A1X9YVK1_9BACT|nr:hypothetical protein CA264_16770 [Pontibacter actiniarum]
MLWKQKITDEELRQGALKLHLFLLESKLENLLSNSQGLASLSPATKNWLADQYYETLMLTSIRRLARVMPSNLFHQIALESVIARAAAKKNLSFAVRSFSKEEEALRWLQS